MLRRKPGSWGEAGLTGAPWENRWPQTLPACRYCISALRLHVQEPSRR